MKKILLITIIGVLFFTSCQQKRTEENKIPSSSSPESISKKVELITQDSINVTDLLDEFKKDKETAKKKYFNNKYLIRGLIAETRKDEALQWTEKNAEIRYVLLTSEKYSPLKPELLPLSRTGSLSEADIQFEGVYCKFNNNFMLHWGGGEKTEILVECKIMDYKRGVLFANESQIKSASEKDFKEYERDRVIAVDCSEREYIIRELK